MQCMDRASLEQLLGQGLSLAEIGRRFDLHESTVSYWAKKYGLEAANRDKHAARGGIAREDLERLVEEGLSIAQIAEALDRGKATVRHWLIRYGLKTQGGRGRRPSGQAKRHEINAKGVALALEKLRVEARKCVLLCSNCHAEVEDGLASIPADALDRTNGPPG